MNHRQTILVSGMIAGDPGQGGAAWAVLQYVLGLQQLGHDVWLVEPVSRSAIQPVGAPLEQSRNARYFHAVSEAFGLSQQAALLLTDTSQTCGPSLATLRDVGRRADLLLNIAGMLADERLSAHIPIRAYLDLDPAFTQLWHATQGIDMRLSGHTHHLTIGLNIGRPTCSIPTCGLPWIPTPQPVVLTRWPAAPGYSLDALTTVGNWRAYGSIEHDGIFYGQKAHSVREFVGLPTQTKERFHLAMAIHPDEKKDLEALRSNGWQLVDPAAVAATPADYQTFIRRSKAEFGIAKSGYAKSRCGWFSDRSVAYLASGKPVIAQDTGFADHLPLGRGLFSFRTTADALEAITCLRADYAQHAAAARHIAEDHFDSDKVLSRLLRTLGC